MAAGPHRAPALGSRRSTPVNGQAGPRAAGPARAVATARPTSGIEGLTSPRTVRLPPPAAVQDTMVASPRRATPPAPAQARARESPLISADAPANAARSTADRARWLARTALPRLRPATVSTSSRPMAPITATVAEPVSD